MCVCVCFWVHKFRDADRYQIGRFLPLDGIHKRALQSPMYQLGIVIWNGKQVVEQFSVCGLFTYKEKTGENMEIVVNKITV